MIVCIRTNRTLAKRSCRWGNIGDPRRPLPKRKYNRHRSFLGKRIAAGSILPPFYNAASGPPVLAGRIAREGTFLLLSVVWLMSGEYSGGQRCFKLGFLLLDSTTNSSTTRVDQSNNQISAGGKAVKNAFRSLRRDKEPLHAPKCEKRCRNSWSGKHSRIGPVTRQTQYCYYGELLRTFAEYITSGSDHSLLKANHDLLF
jgi:hypothetical protein